MFAPPPCCRKDPGAVNVMIIVRGITAIVVVWGTECLVGGRDTHREGHAEARLMSLEDGSSVWQLRDGKAGRGVHWPSGAFWGPSRPGPMAMAREQPLPRHEAEQLLISPRRPRTCAGARVSMSVDIAAINLLT